MQNLYLILLVFFSLNIKAQWVSIPDTNFGKWLNTYGYSQCLQGNSTNGWQMDTTCPAVLSAINLQCPYAHIRDLTGISYFDSLRSLRCDNNLLTSLPSLPRYLNWLNCGVNKLTSLPSLPNNLTFLDCDSNKISVLPPLPNTLTYIECEINLLTSLPTLPNSLTKLYCYSNHLTAVPTLPIYLNTLDCNDNQLVVLPTLPLSLRTLSCHTNQISILPSLPDSLIELYCAQNQLTGLPELPDSLLYFLCYGNPSLNCLPELKRVVNFDFTNTGVTCFPNYGNVTNATPSLSSFPLCDSSNTHGCPYCRSHFIIFPDSATQGVYDGYNQAYGNNLTNYLWEFGDGDTSTLQYPSHNYAQPGHYYVCLTAGGSDCINTYCDSSFYVFKTDGDLMNHLNIINPISTSISQISNQQLVFRTSPNPVTEYLTISVSSNVSKLDLNLSTLTGQRISHQIYTTPQFEIDLSNLPSGVYFLQITDEKENRITKKIVKQ